MNETTATGSASSRSTFSAKKSSSVRGSPGSAPWPATLRRNASRASGSASVGVRANTLTPNGRPVSARVAAMSAAIPSGVL